MKTIWPYLIVGLASGSIYALAGMGLVLTFKTSRLFNFAHGAQAAVAAYGMYQLRERVGLPWPVAAVLVLALVGLVGGLLLERVARRLAGAPVAAQVSATVGLMILLQGVLVVAYGAEPKRMQFFLPTKLLTVGGVKIRVEQVLVAGLVLATLAGLQLLLTRTRRGLAMQAVVADPGLVDLQGTDPVAVRRLAWVIGSGFATLSGMLLGPTTGLDPSLLTLLVFQAFGAAAVGAFASLPLTYAGGLGLGVGAALLTRALDTTSALSALPASLPFIVLFGALLFGPRRRLVASRPVDPRPAPAALSMGARTRAGVLVAGALGLLLVPSVVGVRLPLYTSALGFVMLFVSLSLLVKTSGQLSLCHMTFAAVGAGMFSHAAAAGIPWPLAVLAGALAAVPIGAAVAIPAIRLSGMYLAMATFGFAVLVQNLVFPSFLLFGTHSRVLHAPRPGILSLDTDTGYYFVVLGFAALSCLCVVAIRRNRLGRVLRALADQPTAVDAHGTNSNVTRVLVFCISAFLAGLAGAVAAPVTGSVTAVPYHVTVSLTLVAVLSLAGNGPVLGPFLAAGLYVVAPGYVSNATVLQWLPVVFGVGALVVAMAGGVSAGPGLGTSRRSADRVGRNRVATRARLAASA